MKFICSFPGRTTSKTLTSFSVNPSIFLLPPLSFNISLKDTYFQISINSIVLYLSPEYLLNFHSNFRIPPYMAKIFKFMEFTFLENALISVIFYSCPSSLKTHSQVLVIRLYAEGNYSLPQIAFFRKSVSPNSGKGWRKL